jgi:two-component system OmpR family sensor kinase
VSLRWRLLTGLGILLLVGLVVFGITTYSLYAPTQWTQLDSQLSTSIGPVAQRLEHRAHLQSHTEPGRTNSGRRGATPGTAGPADGGDASGSEPPIALQPGAYAVLVSPSGSVVKRYQVSTRIGIPQLGALLAAARSERRPGSQQFATVGSVGAGPTWRALATDAPGAAGYVVALAIPTTSLSSGLHHLLLVEIEVAGGLLVVLLVGAWLIITRGLRPLEQMAERSRGIAAGDLSQRVGPTSGPTEVVELGAALDTMLGDLERAFAERAETEERLRQFLADASHELRTPLTSIQGFAELFRLNPGAVDLATVARRIEDESQRMKRLVDDLLLLARLDQVSETQAAPVDLPLVVADACAAAVASQPGRPITLDAPMPVVVVGDGAHLRQATSNLLGNALKYTPLGTPIEVEVTTEPPTAPGGTASAVVVVRDHGPGLGEEGLVHAFDRFWRGDAARTGEGAGLGLSIVAAIAREHHGGVTAANAEGGGAVFTLRLALPGDAAPLQRNL